MSPEQSKQQSRDRAAAEQHYRQAARALALREAEYLALDRVAASASAKLEALEARNKAARSVELARRGVINAAWGDGTLAEVVHLGEAVRAMFAEIHAASVA